MMNLRCIRIEKASNGYTMSVEKEEPYSDQPRPYAPPKMSVYKTTEDVVEAVRKVLEG